MFETLIRRERLPASSGRLRLDQAAAQLFPEYSRAKLQAWIKSGELRVDGQAGKAAARVAPGALIEINAQQTQIASGPESIPLDVRFEDPDFLVVNKPAGLVVHPGAGNPTGTLMNALMHYAPETMGLPRAGIIHRLDKETSGLLMVAKSLTAMTALTRQLADRGIKREYEAIVYGHPAPFGIVDAPIGRHPTHRTKMAVRPLGRASETHFWCLARYGGLAHMRFSLVTGRTHQIRVHMEHLGHPLVGDPVYRQRRGPRLEGVPEFGRQALHARHLELAHPVSGDIVEVNADAPDDFQALLTWARASND
ncbi:RluA family pseudouridine synthase [Pseudomonadales bacterium]|jgi:23S rRNA pseudouridine1911/1915/1917 synthase|nr:RluA family pseudouridine synthase [Gammaproteobacteria bacterium]MCH9784925.1 RluA family pseudouridine synthase [Gammaproteobacteria bacterium]MCO4831092.1 RluA family pseudouridine synthase [Gammaproteobacteria bacterium]MDA8912403.1 RluA family pseudouridine synthase [Pseudomonadales bacterium]